MNSPASGAPSLQQAFALFQQGNYAAARTLLDKLAIATPGNPQCWLLLGYIAGQEGRFAETEQLLGKSLALDARQPEAWYYRGMALQKGERHAEAVACYESALRLAPEFFEAHHDLGVSLHALHRHQEAAAMFERALRLNPRSYEAWLNLGISMGKLSRYKDELGCYDRARQCGSPDETWMTNYGIALMQTGQYARAVTHYQSLLEQYPDAEGARGLLINARMYCGQWDEGLDAELAQLAQDIAQGRPAVSPFVYLALPGSEASQREVARRYSEHAWPMPEKVLHRDLAAVGTQTDSLRRLKIAYVSSDFHEHATAYLAAQLFELHDRTRVEIHGISLGPDDRSPMRRRLIDGFDHFTDAAGMTDLEIARRIAALEIDIAVDLKGYTTNARPGIFALRPAPLQVNFLGYPGTMGAPFMDYLIADRHVIPDASRGCYSEKIVWMPDCYQPNDQRRDITGEALSRSDVGLPDSGFVFCSFNNGYKITPDFFRAWMQLLDAVPGSVLWLLETSPEQQVNLKQEAARCGVAAERLVFAPRVPLPQHLRRLQLADLVLDNLPYNAHTTASDALWAGVPLITCLGETFAGRVAASLLHAAGLPQLITTTLADYLALALALARDPARMQALRHHLAGDVRTSALFDTPAFTRALEDGYAAMWQRYCTGQLPDHIVLPRR